MTMVGSSSDRRRRGLGGRRLGRGSGGRGRTRAGRARPGHRPQQPEGGERGPVGEVTLVLPLDDVAGQAARRRPAAAGLHLVGDLAHAVGQVGRGVAVPAGQAVGELAHPLGEAGESAPPGPSTTSSGPRSRRTRRHRPARGGPRGRRAPSRSSRGPTGKRRRPRTRSRAGRSETAAAAPPAPRRAAADAGGGGSARMLVASRTWVSSASGHVSATVVGRTLRAAAMLAAEGNRLVRVTGHRALDGVDERLVDVGPELGQGSVVAHHHGLGDGHRGRPAERLLPGEGLVQDHAEGVEVGRRARPAALDLLRRQVGGRPQHLAGAGEVAGHVDALGDAEVGDLDRPVGRHQHVPGLDVAVDDAGGVGRPQRTQHLDGDGPHVLGGKRDRRRCGRQGCGRAAVP